MSFSTFKISRLLLYFVLASLFLFVAGGVGRYLIDTRGMNEEIARLLQGVIFIGLTLIVLFVLKRKNPNLFKHIGLKGVQSPSKLMIGIALPFVLLILGISTAYLFGFIENIRLNLTTNMLIAILINVVTAFMYEAFPEEVFLRGLIFEELHKKYRFIISLILQMFIFLCFAFTAFSLDSIFFGDPFEVNIFQYIIYFFFAIALQLYRKYTGTLWMSMIFHVVFLEVGRYITIGGLKPDGALLAFDETVPGFMGLYLTFLFMLILSIVVLSVLLLMDRRKQARKTKLHSNVQS